MKHYALGILIGVLFIAVACSTQPKQVAQTWEYKLLSISAPTHERTGANALLTNELVVDEKKLNELGAAGWELTSTWIEPETSFPNMGDGKYVTGIQPNVRPARAVLLFRHAR